MGILAETAGISDSKAILRDLGMKAWNGRSHGLNLKPKRERERGMWPDYLRETCELQVSSAKHIKFDSKQKPNYMPMLGDVRYFAVHSEG